MRKGDGRMRLAAGLPPEKEAAAMNCLFDYLALRQVPQLSRGAVFEYFGGEPAQWLVLFGGSIPEGAELVAKAMREGVARRLMLVGGEGHTTQALRDHIHARRPEIETEGRPEAEVLAAYLQAAHGLRPDAMETRSTNCGNNVSLCLETFRALGERPASLILVQDATMQRRMERTFRKVWEAEPARCLHFAAYEQRVLVGPEGLRYANEGLWGMWEMDRFRSLLLGEIPRLRDDENGYGPKGKGFLAHADIPQAVLEAYALLEKADPAAVRRAEDRYARALGPG